MRNFNKIGLLVSLLIICSTAYSQKFTNKGKDFWVGYGHHQYMEPGYDNSQQMVLYFYTGSTPATVTVKIEGSGNAIPPPVGGPWTRVYSIPANTVISIEDPMPAGASVVSKNPNCIPAIGALPKGLPTDCGFDSRLYTLPPPTGTGGEGPFKKRGIHITSTAPIVAYAHIYASVSSGATMLMPVETWGYNYTCINSDQNNTYDAYSWMYVIAQHDSTWVQITPSVPSRNGRPAGVPFDTVLNRGEIYQLVGKLYAPPNDDAGFNLTGTTIRSLDTHTGQCYPIAVFAGSSRTGGEPPCQTGGRDNDMQQIFPEQSWGKRYLTAPFSNSNSASSTMQCVYKVAIKNPGTIVKRNGVVLTGLTGGKYYKFASSTADYIEADNPILVAQFMGGGCVSGNGDPEMVYLSPIEQAIDSVGFYRNTQQSIDEQFLTLIVPTNGVSSLKIDGTLFNSLPAGVNKASYPHPNLPGYTVCTRRWSPATKGASTAYCDSAFNGLTYGEGGAESYAYNAGTYINNINSVPGIKNVLDTTHPTSQYTCVNTPVRLGISLFYKPTQITWKLLGTPNMTPAVNDTTVGNGSTVLMPADSFYNGTKWLYTYFYRASNNKDTFYFSTPGKKYIDVLIRNPNPETCYPFEKVTLEFDVKARPVLANPPFTYTLGSCGIVPFTTPSIINGDTVQQFIWTFGGTDVTGVQNPTRNFSGGTNGDSSVVVKFAIGNSVGCYVDTTITILIKSDTINFIVNPDTLCQTATGSLVTITPGIAPVTASEWYWDYGDGQIDTLFNSNPFTHTYTTYGSFTIKHSIKNTGGCNPVAPNKIVQVNAQPFATFNISPAGCLPASGLVQFTSTAFAPDGQTVTGHLWNFGDPNANAGNPNTSTLANPTHTYSVVGPYTIMYTATTINGCSKDTIVNTTFNKTPAVVFASLTDVCANASPFNITQGSVTNGVPVTELYAGPGIVNGATGQFDPAVAGVGTHTIWYYATSTTGGCVDSASQTITVKSLLVASFTFPTTCLANGTVQFTNNSTTGVNYSWDFGDGSPLDFTFSPSHTYTGTGPYNVTLSVTSATGCPNSSTQPVTVRIKPIFSLTPIAPVCGSVAAFNITNITITNGVAGSGVFSGPGITNNVIGTFDPTVSGPGAHVIKYIFTTSLGCVDSVSQTINVNPAPFASFTFPTTCLANGIVQFTNNSTGGITNAWDFGDGSPLDNTTSPAHNFAGSGPYNVKLTVTGNGCSKDTTVAVSVRVKPILAYPLLTSVCSNVPSFSVDSVSITNGVTGSGIYSGNGITNGANGTFDPSLAGVGTHTIKYVFTSTLGCSDSITRTITVKAVPFASFTFPTVCLPNSTVQFTNASTGGTSYSWDFGDGSPIVTATSPAHTYTGSGPYNVKLTVLSNGCSKDTTIAVSVRVKPILSFSNLSSVCVNVPAYSIDSATVTNGVTGTGVYSGNGITNGAAGTFNPAIAGVGSHTIKYVFTSTLGCLDSITRTIVVKAIPFASFTFPTNCLPNNTVQFTNTSTGGINYSWDFGDGSPVVTTLSPAHNFAGSGPYNVKLTVLSNGCSKDTTIAVTVRVQPVLAFRALSSVCANVPAYSIDSATVTNGVTGTGLYSGNGITNVNTGIFNPSIAGVGTHTIKYVFTSSLGCKDSISKTITVKAIPFSSFTFPSICLPNNTVQFTNASTGATSYIWDFGDGSPIVTLVSPAHAYTGSGPYNVKLTVLSNGCNKDTTIPVTVRVKPMLSFTPIAAVCANLAPYTITGGSVTNGVTGTGIYSGQGIINGATGLFNPALANLGNNTIKFIFTSTLGCIDSVSQVITVKGVPKAGFTFPTTCLANGTVNFTDTSKLPSGVPSYLWNFGEPSSGVSNTSAIRNAQHSYSGAGPYNVKLLVNINGCSDSITNPITVRIQPQLNFPVPSSVCANAPAYSIATGTVINGVTGVSKYKGKGITDTLLGIFNPAIAGVGGHNITYYFTSILGCQDSVTKQLIVRPVPIASFNYPTGCLTTNSVQFTNTSFPSTGATYLWDFGDLGSGGLNTSVLSGPSHTYNVFGTYPVKLTITVNGCSDDTVINSTFRLQPVINYPPLPIVCQITDTISVNTAVVTNGVPPAFPGSYSGPGVFDTLGLFNPVLAGYGAHTIKFTFTSNGGCIATKTSTITVNPRPVISRIIFNNRPDSNICFNDTLQIGNQVAVAYGNVVKWEWNLGDNTDTTFTTNTLIKYNYARDSVYKITLVTTSDKGCVSLPVSRFIYVRALPIASFTAPAGVCMPNGLVKFENLSTIHNENVSTLSYTWLFGDGTNVSTLTSPSHLYNTSLAQTDVILKVISAYGCRSEDTSTLIFYPKPQSSFTAVPNVACQGKPVAFTNLTVSPNITSSSWNFGDGSSISNAIAPVISYAGYGEFLASLIVTNTNGCKDTATQKIKVYLQPKVDAGKSFVVNAGSVITFQGTVNAPNLTLNWSPSTGLNNSGILNPTTTAVANRKYTLTATGQGGCTDADTMTVSILQALKIPTAFSPNGDGINDKWEITNLKDYPASSVEVFNRYGKSVYLSNGRYTKSWDGTFNGNMLPNGTYYFIIDVKNGTPPISGHVTIVK